MTLDEIQETHTENDRFFFWLNHKRSLNISTIFKEISIIYNRDFFKKIGDIFVIVYEHDYPLDYDGKLSIVFKISTLTIHD